MASGVFCLNKNMSLHRSEHPQNNLLVLLAWLTSTERSLHKYRMLYLLRGFDVLIVRTHITDILYPTTGSHTIAKNLLLYLTLNCNKYSNIVVHGFSVGAYQFSEFLILLQAGLDEEDGNLCLEIKNKIRGVIFDSAVSARGVPHGVAVSVVGPNRSPLILEWLVVLFLKLICPYTAQYHIKAEDTFADPPFRCPAALLCSRTDMIGDEGSNRRIRDGWTRLGIPVVWKCWERSRHVAHMQTHPQEYIDIVTRFLEDLKFE